MSNAGSLAASSEPPADLTARVKELEEALEAIRKKACFSTDLNGYSEIAKTARDALRTGEEERVSEAGRTFQ